MRSVIVNFVEQSLELVEGIAYYIEVEKKYNRSLPLIKVIALIITKIIIFTTITTTTTTDWAYKNNSPLQYLFTKSLLRLSVRWNTYHCRHPAERGAFPGPHLPFSQILRPISEGIQKFQYYNNVAKKEKRDDNRWNLFQHFQHRFIVQLIHGLLIKSYLR